MASSIKYKDTLFKRENPTIINGEPTLEMLQNLRSNIKANAKAVYSNLGGEVHGHLSLVLTDAQYVLNSSTTFFYTTHPGLLIIVDDTTARTTSSMRIVHTK